MRNILAPLGCKRLRNSGEEHHTVAAKKKKTKKKPNVGIPQLKIDAM